MDIAKPCKEEVEKYLISWTKLEDYVLQEKSLNMLFLDLFPENKNINEILIKVSTLKDFYSTRLSKTFTVAKHILELDIDKRLNESDLSLVEDIANVDRRYYSFATKYCSHHNSDNFPIYDKNVANVLYYFNKQDKFAKFTKTNINKDYFKFKYVIDEFTDFYNLEEFSRKELDRYLWQVGREFF